MELFIQIVAAAAIMGILDFFWLGYIAKKLYHSEIGSLLLEKPNMPAALVFYVIYVIGVLVFVIGPAIDSDSWVYALSYGALFGIVAYATYDLTNLATIKGFSKKIVAIDLIWGMFITAATAVGTFFVVQWLG